MNSRARRRRYPRVIRFANGSIISGTGQPVPESQRYRGYDHEWDLRNPDDVRFLFGSFDDDEVAEMVKRATEAANQRSAQPWVVTHIDEKTKTVTLERST